MHLLTKLLPICSKPMADALFCLCYVELRTQLASSRSVLYFRKPKTQRAKRALAKREPKIHENDKKAMFIKGGHTSEKVTQTIKDLVRAQHFFLFVTSYNCISNVVFL